MSKKFNKMPLKAKLKRISDPALYGAVGTLAAAMLAPANIVYAQDARANAEIEEVVVYGTRGALRKALEVKRAANSVVDAISAEDIGKFPDKNLAEALQRVPGVTINRGFVGEGNEVSIRGVNPELTHTMMNGQFVASTEWFSLGANNRSFNMDLLPSELVSSIGVHKSPTASLDEGGVGGTVIVNTRRPLEATDALTVFASLETNTNSLADSDDTGVGATGYVSWKNDDSTFGVSGMVHSNEIVGRADKAENYWEESWSAIGLAEFRQNRERQTVDLTLEYAPTDEQSYTLEYLKTEIDAQNINQNFLVINASDVTPSTSRVAPSAACCGRAEVLPLAGTVNAAANLAQDANARMPVMESDVLHFTGEYEGDGWTLSYELGKTTAEGGNGGNANALIGLGAFDATSGVTVDFNADLPQQIIANINGTSVANASGSSVLSMALAETVLEDEETYYQADVDFDVDWGLINSVEVGVKLRDHAQEQNQYNSTVTLPEGATVASLGIGDGTLNVDGEVCGGNACNYVRIDSGALHGAATSLAGAPQRVDNAFGRIEEDITAFYAQANFEGDSYRGNFGARYVQTDVTGTSAFNVVESDYSELLPSFNIAFDLSDDLLLRGSMARVMSRAGYSSLNPAFGAIANIQQTATQGNSAIEPFIADQADIGLEWYFGEGSLLSGSIFHKDIKSFITTTSEVRTLTLPGEPPLPYRTTIPVQGKGGDLTGFEVQFQKEFENGFGLIANYTYVDAEGELDDGTKVDLPGTSESAYNLSGYYENDKVSVRLAYTYRDSFLAEGTALGTALDSFDDQSFVDLSATYHITDNLDISFEGVNLTEEVTIQNFGSGLNSLRVASVNGARYFVKLAYRY